MNCENSQWVSAYHDGELAGGELARFEQHLASCPQCRQELREVRQLSQLFLHAPLPQMSPAAIAHVHDQADTIGQRGVLRIAEWLTAAAAAVLVVGLMMLFREQPANAQPTTGWEQVAVTLQIETPATMPSDPLQVAELAASGALPKNANE